MVHRWEAARDDNNEQMEYWMPRGLLMLDRRGGGRNGMALRCSLGAFVVPASAQTVGAETICSLVCRPLDRCHCAFLRDLD